MTKNRLKLGQLLVYSGKITEAQLEEALNLERELEKKLGKYLLKKLYY